MLENHRLEVSAEDSAIEVSNVSKSSAEILLTRKNFFAYILPYLSKEEIYSLRQVNKPIKDAMTLFFFSQPTSMRALPAARFSRNQILNFLSDTQKPLPCGIQPCNLVSMLHADDPITVHISLLMHLLKQYNIDAQLDAAVMSKLEAQVYREYVDWSFSFELLSSLLPTLSENERNKYIVSIKEDNDIHGAKAELYLFSLLLDMPKKSGFFSSHLAVMRNVMHRYFSDAGDVDAILHQSLFNYEFEDELFSKLKEMAENPDLAKNKKEIRVAFAAILIGHLSDKQFKELDISQKIINNLNKLSHPTVFQQMIRYIYDNTAHILNKIEAQLTLLNRKNIALLTKEKQAMLMLALFDALPIIKQHLNFVYLKHRILFGDMLWVFERLLTTESNKKLLTLDMKNQLIQFLSLLFQCRNQFDISQFFRQRKEEPFFRITDIIFAADLDLPHDVDFLLYLAKETSSLDRKRMLYLKLREINLKGEESSLSGRGANLMKLPRYFLHDLSTEERSLLIDKWYDRAIKYEEFYDTYRLCLICDEKINEMQWEKIKIIALTELENAMIWRTAYFRETMVKLMEFVRNKKMAKFSFSRDDMKRLSAYLCSLIKKNSYSMPANENCKLILKHYIKLVNDIQLQLFANQVKSIVSNAGEEDNCLRILSMHMLANELTKRKLAPDFVSFMQGRLKEKMNDVLGAFGVSSYKTDSMFRATDVFFMLIAEADFDPTLFIKAFLDYLPNVEKDITSFGHFRYSSSYATNLMLRMNEKDLIQCRQILVNLLDSLVKFKKEDKKTIGFCQNLLNDLRFIIAKLDDDFNYINTLLPLFVDWDFGKADDYEIKKSLLNIIIWQLVSKGQSISDNCIVVNRDDAVYGVIRCIAEKTKVVYQKINAPQNAQESEQEDYLASAFIFK